MKTGYEILLDTV